LRAVATGRRSRISLTGIGDMPLECLAGDVRETTEERIAGCGQGEGSGEPAGLIETLRLVTKKFGLAFGRPVLTDARRRRPTASAGQQAGRRVAIVRTDQVARTHFLGGAQDFALAEQRAAVFGLPGDAQLSPPDMGEKTKRRSGPGTVCSLGAGQEQIGSQNLRPLSG
jgi:hypothetical protein